MERSLEEDGNVAKINVTMLTSIKTVGQACSKGFGKSLKIYMLRFPLESNTIIIPILWAIVRIRIQIVK